MDGIMKGAIGRTNMDDGSPFYTVNFGVAEDIIVGPNLFLVVEDVSGEMVLDIYFNDQEAVDTLEPAFTEAVKGYKRLTRSIRTSLRSNL